MRLQAEECQHERHFQKLGEGRGADSTPQPSEGAHPAQPLTLWSLITAALIHRVEAGRTVGSARRKRGGSGERIITVSADGASPGRRLHPVTGAVTWL